MDDDICPLRPLPAESKPESWIGLIDWLEFLFRPLYSVKFSEAFSLSFSDHSAIKIYCTLCKHLYHEYSSNFIVRDCFECVPSVCKSPLPQDLQNVEKCTSTNSALLTSIIRWLINSRWFTSALKRTSIKKAGVVYENSKFWWHAFDGPN